MKKNLKLRDGHQEIAKNEIVQAFIKAKKTGIKIPFVLTFPANGGKTEISIATIVVILTLFPQIRILVLTHSTNVLKANFLNRLNGLNLDFTYSTDLSDNSQVHITIPQNEKSIVGKYDLVIIDEGHDNYLAEQEQRIVSKVGSIMDLILTATPSKFILKGGYKIHAVGAIELSDEFSAKVNLELVAADGCEWGDDDYNNDDNVISSYEYTLSGTKKTMNSILLKLFERIQYCKSAEEFNNPTKWSLFKKTLKSGINKMLSWEETFNEIGKTLIVCDTIDHANLVHEVLTLNKVESMVSHSENDSKTDLVSVFESSETGILIVVDRCRIGYNDIHLKNLIDLSGTRNPNLIYQMMFRVSRGNQSMDKFYIKVTPKNLVDMGVTEIYVNAALNLMDPEFLLAYNGKNLNNLNVPVLITPRLQQPSDNQDEGDTIIDGPTKTIIPPYANDLVKTLRNVRYDLNKPISIYKKGTIGEAKNIIRGIKERYKKKTLEEILAIVKTKIIDEEN